MIPELFQHRDVIVRLARMRMTEVTHVASFAKFERMIFELEARDALDIDMLAAVLAPYAGSAIDPDENGGPVENDNGFDVMDLVLDTVNPDVFAQLGALAPTEDTPESEVDMAWDGYWEFKAAAFFAVMEFHFGIFNAETQDLH